MDPSAFLDITDADELCRALRAAKRAGDADLVRAIEARMRDLARSTRFAHLSDDELAAQIGALTGERAPKDMLAHAPDFGFGSPGDAAATLSNNVAIRANQAGVGIEERLAALRAEQTRRATPPEG